MADNDACQIHTIIGHFGRYQLVVYLFKVLIGVTSAFNNLGVTFFAPSAFVSHWCMDTETISNSTSLLHSPASFSNISLASAPKSDDLDYLQVFSDFLGNDERTLRHSSNLNLDIPTDRRKECSYITSNGSSQKCSRYQYDSGIWLSTIIEEWDLVCDKSWLISLSQSLYMSSMMLAFVVFGYMSDRFGRWIALLFGALFEVIGGFGCAFSNSITTFMIFRGIMGFGNAGRSSASYLMMIEWTGPDWRMHISTLGALGWTIGYCTMPWITIHYLHFRHMQLFVCLYEIVFIIWLIWIPESPRFLLARKRFDEAREVLLKAAKFNGLIRDKHYKHDECYSESTKTSVDRTVTKVTNDRFKGQIGKFMNPIKKLGNQTEKSDDEALGPYTMAEFQRRFDRLVTVINEKEFVEKENKLNIFDLFRWKNLRKYTLILSFIWASNSFIYYGIALGAGSFGESNIFISFSLSGLSELPSMAFTILFMRLLPRRTSNLCIFLCVGTLCALQIPLKYYKYSGFEQSTMLLAKLVNSISFTCILYQTMELFPTSIRQTAYNSCAIAGRIGSNLAPFIKELTQVTNVYVGSVIYTIISILSAILIIDLPETKGSDLTDTLMEAERLEAAINRQSTREASASAPTTTSTSASERK